MTGSRASHPGARHRRRILRRSALRAGRRARGSSRRRCGRRAAGRASASTTRTHAIARPRIAWPSRRAVTCSGSELSLVRGRALRLPSSNRTSTEVASRGAHLAHAELRVIEPIARRTAHAWNSAPRCAMPRDLRFVDPDFLRVLCARFTGAATFRLSSVGACSLDARPRRSSAARRYEVEWLSEQHLFDDGRASSLYTPLRTSAPPRNRHEAASRPSRPGPPRAAERRCARRRAQMRSGASSWRRLR